MSFASASFEFHHSALLVSAERNNAMRSQKTDNEQDVTMNDFGDSVIFEIVRIFFFVTVCLLLVIHALVYRVFWDCVNQTPKLSAVRCALLRAPCRPKGCLCPSRASLSLPRPCVPLTLDVVHQFRPALGGCPSLLLRYRVPGGRFLTLMMCIDDHCYVFPVFSRC